jgi:hypothetical protein
MQEFGITEEIINAIETKREEFADMPTDEEMSGIMVSATEDKNTKANELRKAIRKVTIRVQNKYGNRSGEYRRFGVNDLSRMSDPDLYKCGKRVHRVGTSMLADLQSEGLTQEILDDVLAKTNEFDDAIDAQDDAVRERDLQVERRIELGNAIFEELQKISNTGKAIWQDENEAKYNDYVINKSSVNVEEDGEEG